MSSLIHVECIALFDMDGTLTEPREKISKEMIEEIVSLVSVTGASIGIVTGSSFEYIAEQLDELMSREEIKQKLIVFPCNGTRVYMYDVYKGAYKEFGERFDIQKHLGEDIMTALMAKLVRLHLQSIKENVDMPLAGDFIVNRGSLINFCLPGRASTKSQRKKFIELDSSKKIRERLLNKIKKFFSKRCIDAEAALGGSTSIDIFPRGHNKTFCITRIDNPDMNRITFVGDRCKTGGNDREIFELLGAYGNSFETTGIQNTIEIIQHLKRILK